MRQYIALSGNVFRSTLEVHDSPYADDAIVLEVALKGLGEQVGDDQHTYIAFAPDAFVQLFGSALEALKPGSVTPDADYSEITREEFDANNAELAGEVQPCLDPNAEPPGVCPLLATIRECYTECAYDISPGAE